ncbi:UvrD-helicase domain-containing protein, partial [PVC group bacterium]|nr:UvrD-helicase domain-containing protein [PVC group bacterium]
VMHKDGPLLIIAGAGSGKPRVLTRRIAYLIQKGVAPNHILAVTFTNKAAQEMKERITRFVHTAPMMGTFHSVSVKILRKHISLLGYSSSFTIYDMSDQASLIKLCLKELKLDDKKFHPKAMVEKISRMKDQLVEAATDMGSQQSFWENQVSKVYKLYENKLRKNNGLDFGDLILLTVKLFQTHPEILKFYQDTLRYILIDEYQDTNFAQYVLIKLLASAHKNICVVGDPDQSIYSWRGADVTNILMFEKDYPKSRVIKLEENYRSTQNILDAANQLIQNNSNRKEKKLWTERPKGENVYYYEALDERDEAMFTVQKLSEFTKNEGVSLNQIVIFYRVHAQSRVLEDFLRRFNVPYKIIGGISFYARREIKDILAYLRLVNNISDDAALMRIINVPARGIGQASMEKLINQQQISHQSLFDILKNHQLLDGFNAGTRKKFHGFILLMESLQAAAKNSSISELIQQCIRRAGFEKMFLDENSFESKERLENIRELVSSAREMELDGTILKLEDFLEKVTLASSIEQWDSREDTLSLMTLHSAKGLEFPVVFIVGLEESLLPHANSLYDGDDLEEERRLCYVGITRAEKKLFLSSAIQRITNGKFVNNFPSRFLEEMATDQFERLSYSLSTS